ncbi:terminus macrodomain insulation protein YfbV [Thorsellia kenyensis]|uniref:UPF0208 membrane protein YfbV n=1 Tax=Thorsellia kenyensis TaxID=1549888 RepID=A0ABV6CCZ5_9GAMM
MSIQIPPRPPKDSFWALLRQGQNYRKTFPRIKLLSLIFKEYHVIKITGFAIRGMPPLAVFSICWALMLNANLAIATTAATFALSIPIQCLYWLGKRASSPIPTSLNEWLKEIHQKLNESGQNPPALSSTPSYLEFANILKLAFETLDEEFIESL